LLGPLKVTDSPEYATDAVTKHARKKLIAILRFMDHCLLYFERGFKGFRSSAEGNGFGVENGAAGIQRAPGRGQLARSCISLF
jgi:hypothetical protein